jgi:hypothetical protein
MPTVRANDIDSGSRFGRLCCDKGGEPQCPRQELNLRTRFRKPLLYPLSYGGEAHPR